VQYTRNRYWSYDDVP